MIKSTIIPVNTIKSLNVNFCGANNNVFVYHLCCKFLKVDDISLMFATCDTLSYTTYSLLISYLNSIPQVKVLEIPIKTDDLEAMISKQVKSLDNVSWGLHMEYIAQGDDDFDRNLSYLSLSKQKIDMPFLLVVNQDLSRLDLESVPFFKRYGKYIRYLSVHSKILYPESTLSTITSDYLLSLFQKAPNLECPCFHACTMNDFEWEYEPQQKATLKKMTTTSGHLHENLFVNFSRFLKTVHLLVLSYNQYFNIQNECGPFINIRMENTTVTTLHFRSHQNEYRGKRYFFLNINTTRHGDVYYVYDTKDRPLFKVSSKEEFEDATKAHYTHLSLMFYDLGSISVKHANKKSVMLKLGN